MGNPGFKELLAKPFVFLYACWNGSFRYDLTSVGNVLLDLYRFLSARLSLCCLFSIPDGRGLLKNVCLS